MPQTTAKGRTTKKKPGRRRSEKARRAILGAAREMLHERGLAGVTVEGIAKRAGVGKPTIYRYWSDAKAVAMSALLDSEDWSTGEDEARGVRGLRRQLAKLSEVFATPTGRQVAIMVAASEDQTELSKVFRKHFILARREEGRMLVEEAIEAGEMRDDLDVEVVLDLIYAPVFYRLLLGEGTLDQSFTNAVLRTVLVGTSR